MTYPASDVVTTNTDASTDSPASARADILDLMQKFNQLRNHITSFWQTTLNRATAALVRTDLGSTTVGDAVFVAASAAAGRTALGAAASGANADITSLASPALGTPTGDLASCTIGGTYKAGFKGLPPASVTTGAFAAADAGKCVYATAGVTAPNATMAAYDSVVILNTTGSAITVTQAAGLTLRKAGTATTGNMTLAAYGIGTVVFTGASAAIISGNI